MHTVKYQGMRLIVTGSSYMSDLICVFIFQFNSFLQIIRLTHKKCFVFAGMFVSLQPEHI